MKHPVHTYTARHTHTHTNTQMRTCDLVCLCVKSDLSPSEKNNSRVHLKQSAETAGLTKRT